MNVFLEEGSSAEVTMEWPDNIIPKASFTADVILAALGESITFNSLCTPNTKK